MRSPDADRFKFLDDMDLGHGGAYSLALNPDASRLFVVGEFSWLDILDITDPSSIRSLAQRQFEGMPYGHDGNYGIAYDPHLQRVVVGGGSGGKIFLIDVSGDQLRLLDAAYPPEILFPQVEFPGLTTTPPVFVKQGSAIAATMKTGGSADDPSSGQTVYFGEGVYLLSIDPVSYKMYVVDEGIGGFSTIYGLFYDPTRDLLWCGGRDGAEAIVDFSCGPIGSYRYWRYLSGTWRSKVMPDCVTHDGKWLVERVASLHPLDHWFVRIRQIEAVNRSYSLWNADMPTDGAAPHLLGSPINLNGDTTGPGSRVSSKPLLPSILSHDETRLITAEAGGRELLVLDLTDKTAEPRLLLSSDLGEGEQIQSIKSYRNRFYVSLKSGRVVVYEWSFVNNPRPPESLTAVASSTNQNITLSWTPPSAGVTPAGYNVYRRAGSEPFRKVATVTEATWTDESTAEGTAYIYMVRSFAPHYGPVESDDSTEAEATTPTNIPPEKVLGLSGEATLAGVAIWWECNPEADVIGYFVYRATGDAPFAKITPSPLTEPRYHDANLGRGQDYSYCVTAVDALLEGPSSETVTLAPGDRTPNLLLNPGAEQQCLRHWAHSSTTFLPDPGHRYSFHNDLFISVTNADSAEGGWAFWADQTSGRYDRETYAIVDAPYFLAAYQDVGVSPFSAPIDAPEKEILADWAGEVIRTAEQESVIPRMAIEFLDADRSVLKRHELSSEEVGDWVKLSSSDPLPAGTRCIRFWMFASDVTTSPANAAWDDLWLTLREGQPHHPLRVAVSVRASGPAISFGPTVPGKSYQIEYSEDLPFESTAWKPCGPCFDGDSAAVEWLDSPDEQINPTHPPVSEVKHRFYRVSQR